MGRICPDGACHKKPYLQSKLPAGFWDQFVPPGQTKDLNYDQIDGLCRRRYKKSFFQFCLESGSLNGIFRNESDFKRAFKEYVTRWLAGDSKRSLILFNSLAEEANFLREADGTLSMGDFSGMNAPHKAVLDLFNRFLQECPLDPSGRLRGTAKIKVDAGSGNNDIEITIDFDRGTISPPLKLISPRITKNGAPVGGVITFSELVDFFDVYLKKDSGGEAIFIKGKNGEYAINPKRAAQSAMNVFLSSLDIDTIRHEFFHALYDNNPGYRERVLNLVRKSNIEQREAAVLATACAYDVFDPDAPTVTRDLVIDEIYNAYSNEKRFDLSTMSGNELIFGAERFCAKYNLISTILRGYERIEDLPISQKEKALIRILLVRENYSGITEKDLLSKHPASVLSQITDMASLRKLLIARQPEFYDKVVLARKKLVDWVDNPS